MTKRLFTAALACAALAMPAAALADDAMGGNAMSHDAMANAKPATMMCRPAAAGEKATATMTNGSKTALVCKPISMDKMKTMMPKGADEAAWRQFVEQAIMIPGGTGGG
jgi:hypothetical protein